MDVTPARIMKSESDRKVIFLLVDALREDFVQFDEGTHQYLDSESPSAYKGKKLKVFHDFKQAFPERTMLLPLVSEMPTVTVVRIKSLLTGALTSIFELSEEFNSQEVTEDNVLS